MYTAAIFLPLIGAILAGVFGRMMGDRASMVITTGLLMISAILGAVIFYMIGFAGHGKVVSVPLFNWIVVGDLKIAWALRFDTLSAVMVFVVTLVSSVVHLYSIGYMSHDPHRSRFFAYLSLFTFSMLMLVTAENFIQMFFGWEGVGVCSYLLIGFWFKRESANAAAIKAFVVNRIGDYGFLMGIFGVFAVFGSLEFANVFPAAASVPAKTLTLWGTQISGQMAMNLICIFLFIGAMGKSAQLFLHTWLPDAMEGPTPVSALIHAATMVTAGVFLVARLSPMFEYAPTALAMVTIIGGSTAFFAATIGMVQNDIKRVVAYSTCSQLGYMFFAAGVSAYPAAIFHLMTHAFFKALLFLGSGAVIHGVHDEQDMRKMGGLWRKMKLTYIAMWIGSLALAGIPLFAGYYSKDIILESAFAAHTGLGQYAFWMGIAAALMTAFYSWRLIFMTFHGKTRADKDVYDHAHDPGPTMLIPLGVLALGACFAGYLGYEHFVGHGWKMFWEGSITVVPHHEALEHAHHVPEWVQLLPLIVGVVGIVVALAFYILFPSWPKALARGMKGIYLFLLNKWYFDELYDRIFVRPAFRIGGFLWKGGDGKMIDGLGPDGISAVTLRASRRVAALQSGFLYHYAFAILIGVAIFVTIYLLGWLK